MSEELSREEVVSTVDAIVEELLDAAGIPSRRLMPLSWRSGTWA